MLTAVPEHFTAYRIHQRGERVEAAFERVSLSELSDGEVVVRVAYSSVNYKDALAVSGAGRILRRYPLIGGIDLAGVVVQSSDASVHVGDAVLVTGCGLSETRDGGYTQYARVPAAAVVALPPNLDCATAMAIGTAGYSAARAILRLEQAGQTPSAGPILVSGASGGVGSLAIDLLAGRGYEVVALTGKRECAAYLHAIGAARVMIRDEEHYGTQVLESQRWGGAIDTLGGETLSWLLRSTREGGNVASIGLAASAQLSVTVMPFILREVSLIGVNSVSNTRASRLAVWARLASDLAPRHLPQIVTARIDWRELPARCAQSLAVRTIGRTLVQVSE